MFSRSNKFIISRVAWTIIHRQFSGNLTNPIKFNQHLSKKAREKTRLTDYLLFAFPLTTFALGTWQVIRYHWKQELKRQISSQLKNDPTPLPEDLRQTEEYQRVQITGHFDHSKEQYIGPRVFYQDEKQNIPSMLSSTASGYWVVTPFKLADRNCSILVNRGWVPKAYLNPEDRPDGQVEGEITITGIVRRTEMAPMMASTLREKNGLWMRRDIDKMAQAVDAAPFMIDVDAESSIKGGPIGGQTRVTLVDNHMSYVITWYILTVVLLYVCIKRIYVIKTKTPLSI